MSTSHFVYKIMILGDPSVGKTSLIRRYVEDRFSEEYITTIGVDFLKKEVKVEPSKASVTLVLWDVAGQAKYANFKKYYYQGADFIIIVFDITRIQSYKNIVRWLEDAQELLGRKMDFAIFANKIDLKEHRAVQNYDDCLKIDSLFELIETSAKTGQNVNEIFSRIAKYLVDTKTKKV